jgi:hypothetical protein
VKLTIFLVLLKEEVLVAYNSISGSIPTELLLATNLGKVLAVAVQSRSLNVRIYEASFFVSCLVAIDFTNTAVTGSLPTEIGKLAKLGKLLIFDQRLHRWSLRLT